MPFSLSYIICLFNQRKKKKSAERMKLSLIHTYSRYICVKAQTLTLCGRLQRPFCSSSLEPKTPLFLRPPKYSATLSQLKKWHDWAKTLTSSADALDSPLLCRELNWLIEDSLEHHSVIPQLGIQDNSKNVRLRVDVDELYSLWKQRVEERKPFQYIVGCEHWRDLVLSVEEGVFIPRPETELLVDLVSDAISNNEELKQGLWVDLGTGSGAIAIGIARILRTGGTVIATDLNPLAASVAAFNVQRYGLQDVIEIRQGSWLEPLKDIEEKLSGIISNPPYIPSTDIPGLQPEVGRHEPRLALDGGLSGMDDLLYLCNQTASLLKPGGFFAFETNGEKQCKFLLDYLENDSVGSFCNVKIVSDFAGIPRFLTGFCR